MLRLPRTATGSSKRQHTRPQAAASTGSSSPTEVLSDPQRARSAKALERSYTADLAPEGHAQDVLHLLTAGWFGPLARSKAAPTVLPFEDSDEETPRLPVRRRQQQQQQQKPQQQQQQAPSQLPPQPQQQQWGAAVAGPESDRDSDAHTGGSSHSHRSQHSDGTQHPPGQQQQEQRGTSILSRPALIRLQQDRQAAAAIQDLPGIGTWAGRYRLFGGKRPQQAQQQQAEAEQAGAASLAQGLASRADAEAQRQHAAQDQHPQQQQRVLQPSGGSFGSPVVLRPGGFGGPVDASEGRQHGWRQVYGSEEAQEDVWRWRFSKKWATEQQRYYEGAQPGEEPGSLVSDDLDALAFTQACGTGVNMQVMPTSARRPSHLAGAGEEGQLGIEGSHSTLSLCQFDVDASYMSAGALSAEMSPGNSTHGARAAAAALQHAGSGAGRHARGPLTAAAPSPRGPSATRTVLSMAHKARDLLQKQGAIEAEVEDRWERTRSVGGAWVGDILQPVRIDMLGRFKYCVLRVSDGGGHTRFLVRGRAGASPAQLLEAAQQEAAGVSRTQCLPTVTVEVVGGGRMEWREDTERELHVQPSTIEGDVLQRAASDSPTKNTPYLGDMSGLTASLVRQALPCHFRITTALSQRSASGAFAANRI